jgi:hypothetical protein
VVVRAVTWIVVAVMGGAGAGCGDDAVAVDAGPPPEVVGTTELDLHEDVAPFDEPTYENVAKLFRGDEAAGSTGLCAYASGCHNGSAGKAGLTFRLTVFDDALVYRALVENANGPVQSCEYHPLRRVEPGDPDKSWLYIKLAAHANADGQVNVLPAEDWDATLSPCSKPPAAFPFPGSLMPFSEEDPVTPLEPSELRMVAEWILDGAPGPATP